MPEVNMNQEFGLKKNDITNYITEEINQNEQNYINFELY